MGPQVGAIHHQVQVFEEMVFFVSVYGDLETDVVGVLAKRTDVRYDHGFAESKRAHQSSGVFADGGITQVEYDIAGREITHEIVDGSEAERSNRGREAERIDQRRELELGMRLAYQDHAGAR